MKKNYKKISKLLLFTVFLIGFGQVGFGQGTETFNNIPANSTSYTTRNWTGDDGSGWTATYARTDQTVNGRAITLGSTGTPYVLSGTISGGCGNLSFKHQQEFSGSGGHITQVQINGTNKLPSSVLVTTTINTTTINNINISGNFTIKIITDGNERISIDDVSWTAFAAGPEMNIKGNSFNIADGDNTPSTPDHTDFGNVCTSSHVDRIFTIQNTGVATLNFTHSPIVVVTGTGFSVLTQPSSSSIASGGADLTFTVRFAPTANGVINGTISIDNNDTDENPYNFSIKGTGGNFPPTVTSPTATSITSTTATLGGTISNTGCTNVTERGIYWSTTNGFADGTGTKVSSTPGPYGTGAFTEAVTGLSPATTYYYKAFATNSGGTDYTSQGTFTTACGTVTTMPFIENFDNWRSWNGTVGSPSAYGDEDCWTNENGEADTDATDWTGRSAAIASSNTGPDSDHTGGGNFIYIESSGSTSSKHYNAIITSPTIDISSLNIPYLTFYYHMYGAAMGTLKVHIYYNGSWHNNQTITWNGVASAGLSGDQGDSWKKATLDLSAAAGYSDFAIRFEGKSGDSYTSDMAIDDVRIGEKPLDDVTNFTIDCPAKTSMDITWTKPVGTYGTDWDGVIVFARATSAVDAVVSGNDASSYTANSVYGSGTQNANSYCVAKTTTDADGDITVTGLTAGVKYYFTAYTYKEVAGASNDKWSMGVSNYETTPTSIANVTQAVAYGGNLQATVRWQNISCYDEVLVIGHAGSSVSATPSGDGSAYTPNSVFGSGTDMGSSNYVVYKNVGTGVTVTNLNNGTTYYFKIFVRKGNDWSTGVEVSVTPNNGTWFKPGELIIVGFDSETSGGNRDKIYLATLVDIKPGTEFYYINSRFEAGAAANQRTMEWWGGSTDPDEAPGAIKFTNSTNTITAGSIITFEINESNSPTVYNLRVANNSSEAAVTGFSATNVTTSRCNISGGGSDQLFLIQGKFTKDATENFYHLNGRVLFGMTNGINWVDLGTACSGGSTREARLHPDLECFNIQESTLFRRIWYKNSSTHGTSKNAILSALMNTGNWTKSTSTDPDLDVPEDFTSTYVGTSVGKPFDASGSGTDGTWTGNDADNDNWFKCGNWEGLVVPDNSMDVTIPNVTNDCSIDYNASDAVKFGRIAECHKLIIKNGGVLYLDGNSLDKLYVMGSLRLEFGGKLDMDGGSTEDGNLYLYGAYNNLGPNTQFDEGHGTVNFVGNKEQKIYCTSAQEIFYNLTVNNTNSLPNDAVSFNSAGAIVNGTFNHVNGRFYITPSKKLTINGIYNRTNGTFRGQSTSDLTISGSGKIDKIVFNGNTMLNNFIINRTSHDVTISPTMYLYSNLNIANNAVLKANNNIYLYSAVANTNTNGRREGTGYIVSQGATNTFSGNGYFGNMMINADANMGTPSNFTVNNFIINNSTAVYNSTNQDNLYVEGNFTNNYGDARFNNDGNLMTHFSGTGTQTITASSGQTFYDVDVHSGSDVITQASLLNVNSELAITGTFTIPENKFVSVGTIDINPNNAVDRLILKSSATGTASLIQSNGAVPATVERYITGNKWHYMYPTLNAIPTTTYTAEGSDVNENLYSYNEANKDYWNATTIYETTGWTSEVASTNLRTDKAYIYNRYGMASRTVSQTGGNLTSSDVKFKITYNTNTGAIGNGCVTGWNNYDGWNLIGNPYASAIDWDETLSLQTGTQVIENGMYCYDDSQDKYQYYVSGGGNSSYNSVGITVNSGSKFIPAGQGFMVKALSAVGTSGSYFYLKKGARTHNTKAFWKGGEKEIIPNLVRLNIEKDGYTDETVIRTLPQESGVTEDHDGYYDAYKLFAMNNLRPQIYSRTEANDRNFAINSIPEFTGHKIIPLGLYIGETGEHKINMTENNFENTHIWLEDALLNINTNLLHQSSYSFNQTAEQNNERFFLHFEKNNAPELTETIPDQVIPTKENYNYFLPKNMFADTDFQDSVTITVSLENGNHLPEWLTYDSKENKFIGTPQNPQVLYIKVTETDIFGAYVYDKFVLTVKNPTNINTIDENSISVYPNPTDGIISVQLNNLGYNAKISIEDITGKILKITNSRSQKTELDLSRFAKGLYFVDIKIAGQTIRKKIVLK